MAATKVAPRRKPWCGDAQCNEQTRQIEVGEDRRPVPCPRCHPRLVGYESEPGPSPTGAAAADPAWWAAATAAVRQLARERHGRELTVRDLRADRFGLGAPSDHNQWGAVMMWASQAGLIRRVGDTASPTPSRHGGRVSVWVGAGEA